MADPFIPHPPWHDLPATAELADSTSRALDEMYADFLEHDWPHDLAPPTPAQESVIRSTLLAQMVSLRMHPPLFVGARMGGKTVTRMALIRWMGRLEASGR